VGSESFGEVPVEFGRVARLCSAGTQTRTFAYNGKYLTSATNPENGTVNYTYTANGKLASKTDAKGQQIVYTYDAYLRLTQIRRYPTPGNEDICQRTLFYYDSNPFVTPDRGITDADCRTSPVRVVDLPVSSLVAGSGHGPGVHY
jgi:YD repeat-containing protein